MEGCGRRVGWGSVGAGWCMGFGSGVEKQGQELGSVSNGSS